LAILGPCFEGKHLATVGDAKDCRGWQRSDTHVPILAHGRSERTCFNRLPRWSHEWNLRYLRFGEAKEVRGNPAGALALKYQDKATVGRAK
jgi:hypothetical protein